MSTQSIEVRKTGRDASEARPSATRWSYRPAIDVVETDEQIVILADVPGAKAEDIEIDFDADHLQIHARVRDRSRKEVSEIIHEHGIGDFDREFRIDVPVDPEAIRAELSLGTLTVHLPKPPQLRPRRIPVSGD